MRKPRSEQRTKYVTARVTKEKHREIVQFAREAKKPIAELVLNGLAQIMEKGVKR